MLEAEDEAALYLFERRSAERHLPPARRSREDAIRALETLRRRLGIPKDVELTRDLEKLLLRYCTDTVLNILWYERARKKEQQANARRTYLMIGLMIVALLLVCASAFTPGYSSSAAPGATILPLALLGGGALTVLQVIAALGDGKARLAIFWKAGADLKEALYNFEHKWHGRVFQGSPLHLADDFDAAVHEELRSARAVTRAERLEFFTTLRSPSDVLAVAVSTMNGLRAQRAEGSAVVAAREERIGSARKTASEARAAVLASEYRLRTLTEPAEKQAEEAALVKARAEVVRTEAILQEVIGG
ncbi:MAG TPA: hypothetical protein VF469_04420 [Kofleriaceae bacterium]